MLGDGKSQTAATVAGCLLLLATILAPITAARSSEPIDASAQKQPAASSPAAPAAKEVEQILKPVVGKNYVILPIATDLQRARGRAYETAKFFVLINGQALFNDDDTVLNMAPLGLQALRKTMQAQAQAGVKGDTVIHIRWPLPLPTPRDYDGERASSAFQCFLEHSYITSGWPGAVRVEMLWPNRDWKYANAWDSLVADVTKEPPEGAIEAEAGIGDDQVKLYAVRTPLSRFLFDVSNTTADCVIHIIPPIEEAKASAVLTMQRCLPQLNLKKKNFAWFLETWKDPAASNAVNDDFSGEHVWKDLLDFKSCGHMVWN